MITAGGESMMYEFIWVGSLQSVWRVVAASCRVTEGVDLFMML